MGVIRQRVRKAPGKKDPSVIHHKGSSRNAFHPKSLVMSREIGPGTRVWPFAHIMEGAQVGRDCNIGEGCYLEKGCRIGNRVTIKNGVAIWDGVTLEDDVFVGPQVSFTNDPAPRSRVYLENPTRTLVRKGASLGSNSTILSGLQIGMHALVGAGAVVTKDVPSFALVYGNPARLRAHVCVCAKKLEFQGGSATCRCGKGYVLRESMVYEVGLDKGKGRNR